MRKASILLLLFFLFVLLSFGQTGYYKTDSLTVKAVISDMGRIENSRYCYISTGNNYMRLKPSEIKEYMLPDGRIYVSEVINHRDTVFLEKIAAGDITLFLLKQKERKSYFFKVCNGNLIQLSDSAYKFRNQFISQLGDFDEIERNVAFVKYSENSLRNLADFYNSPMNILFPYNKFGLVAGVSYNKLLPKNKKYENMPFKGEPVFVGGFFFEHPFPQSIVALRVEALYMKSAFSYHTDSHYSSSWQYPYSGSYTPATDLLMDIKTISVPVLMRISDGSRKLGMFVDLGVLFSYNVQNEWHIYNLSDNGDIYINEVIDNDLNANALLGYSFGFGFYKYFGRSRAYIGGRYNRLTPVIEGILNLSQLQVVAGFSF